ncbi:hypothetical protein [Streptomyces litchfieldiae]|uniref:Secreted protein n=1 Tax=Streptomyces litchfieldiae TaxID=3075543 RepID=A0ABU2MVR3_9ACTN|nr:hypothetical protein [Streptomyces sp. DSM 44938]MDT0345492.1 hypothetical protein [Streptomyces sp. DSM 44938]
MKIRNPGRRYAVAGALAAVCVLAAAPAGNARPAPEQVAPEAFLTGDELPTHVTGWYSSGAQQGLPEWPVFCFENELPAEGSWHQPYWTEYDTNAVQVIVETGTAGEAAELADALTEAAADCAPDWLRDNPGSTAGWDDHGPVDAADGGHIFSVYTAPPEAGTGVRLFGIGRDGTRVTVVDWGQMGQLSDAPVDEFRTTLTTALAKLGA